jgi:hypothetical protein
MLQTSERLLRMDRSGFTVRALEVFVRHVDVMIRTGRLSPTKGQPLINEANRIIDLLTS